MTSKIEDELNLPRLKDALQKLNEQDEDAEPHMEQEQGADIEDPNAAESYQQAMQKTKKLENDLIDYESIERHDKEMDEVSDEAMSSYKDLMDLGMNIEAKHSVQMLKIALDARNSKSEKKLRLMRLQLEQARLQRDLNRDNDENPADGGEGEDAITTDRNSLLNMLEQMQKGKG
jgi:hypothetical protein